VQYTRQEVVDILRNAGLFEAADKAAAELPDPVEVDEIDKWGTQYGVTRDLLISQFGGSP
jgi:hypothetical protein